MTKIISFSALALLLGLTSASAQYRPRGATIHPEITRPYAGGAWYYMNGVGSGGRRYSSGGPYGNGIGTFGELIGPIAPEANGG
jgi:uncharacterized membrane protein